jgi:alkylhydroperoxidase/carboxymuconolactone decarboxylase family protein YurZ
MNFGCMSAPRALLQVAVYAGVPAANSAYHHAADAYREMDEEAAR